MKEKIKESEISTSLIEINLKYSEWQNMYTFGRWFNMRIFSFIFPTVLKINITRD